ncbi:alpha/beta-hydrolase [Marasmius fiardii PR-910]|nr:alpha/beta-hydrolase [Marasmius fiardii PR-910]
MNTNSYKDLKTSRGLNYHYYFSPPTGGKHTLVLLHGFPSTSYDWRRQVPFFKEKGYGLIVPDMLGYGGTAKPTDPAEYKPSLITKDIVDILDEEKIEKVVVIGHDWGSRITCRFVQRYPERVIAIGLLAVGYQEPTVQFDYEKVLAFFKEKVGYEVFGYWEFFCQDEAPKLVEENFEKFFNLTFPENPKQWIADFIPRGALKNYLTTKPVATPASWLNEEEKQIQSEALRKGGLAAPMCWYRVLLSDIASEDDKEIPAERYKTDKPVFFGAALEDHVAIAALNIHITKELCKNITVKEFQAGHWVQLQRADEVNKELEAWLGGL